LLALAPARVGWGAESATVNNVDELNFALGNGNNPINLGGNIDLPINAVVEISQDVRLNGSGNQFTGTNFAINIINNASVVFDHLTVSNANNGRITINTSTTVTFQEAMFTGNQTTGGVVNVTTGEVTFEGGTFETNRTAGNGGIANVEGGTVTFRNGTFRGNQTTGSGSGGVVNVAGGTVTFTGGTFGSNSAAGNGGVVNVGGGTVAFQDGTFTSNNAVGNGGVANVAGGTVAFRNGSFRDNQTTGAGNGGIVNVGGGGVVAFEGGTFESNRTAGNGGVANIGSGTVTFQDGVFQGNYTTGSGNGGVVYVGGGGTVAFTRGAFANNRAVVNGGVVYADLGVVSVSFAGGTAGITFTDNSAIDGGALYLRTVPTVFSGTLFFSGNTATHDGGAIFAENGLTIREGASFLNSVAGASGGAIYSNIATVRVEGGRFATNRATGNGGAVAAGSGQISGGEFSVNVTEGSGGAFYATGAVDVDGGSFIANRATANGGAVSAGTVLSTIRGGTFSTNEAQQAGGAFYAGGAVNVSGGTFTANKAAGNGGAITAGLDASVVSVSGGDFTENTAGGSGGAVYGGGEIRITGGFFGRNHATGTNDEKIGGGAVFAMDNISVTPAESITFDGNTVRQNGGALHTQKSLSATNVIFTNNRAEEGNGGAIYSFTRSDLTNCVVGDENQGNIAGKFGGGVCAGVVVATRTTFRANNAAGEPQGGFGGAVYYQGDGESQFDYCWFALNQAKNDGGALYFSGANHRTRVTNTVFESNYSIDGSGGAVSVDGNRLLFSSCTFTSNIAGGAQGGAVFTNAATFKFSNCTFVDNTAGNGRGGALFLSEMSGSTQDSVVFYCTFTENLVGGGQGGAVYTAASIVKFAASVFVSNTGTFGEDVFKARGTIISRGYNILGNYGAQMTSGPSANVDWAAAEGVSGENSRGGSDRYGRDYTRNLIFGSNALAANPRSGMTPIMVGSDLKIQQTLNTLETAPTTPEATNPALDYMPGLIAMNLFNDSFGTERITHTDERGVDRPNPRGGNSDVGAFEREDGGLPPTPPTGKTIAYIIMSGIPNTMVKIGQTCSLTALVYYQNGESTYVEPVRWSSSNPRVATIDQYGNLVSLSRGTTQIGVVTEGYDFNNNHAEDSAELVVSEEWSYTNIHPDVWTRLIDFNDGLQQYAEQVYFLNDDPTNVMKAAFATTFKIAYGVTASHMSDLPSVGAVSFNSKPSYTGDKWVSAKPSIAVSVGSLPSGGGSLVPLKFIYSMSWEDVSEILGRETTEITNLAEASANVSVAQLFDSLKLVFEDAVGTMTPVVDADGEFGINAARVVSSGSLSQNNGDEGLTLSLEMFLGDVKAASDGKPQLIDRRLVVADGAADGTAKGSLWLLKRVRDTEDTENGNESDESGGGGGGGCDAGMGFLPLLPLALGAVWTLKRRKD
jgi:predicted outer membrane repeat protein